MNCTMPEALERVQTLYDQQIMGRQASIELARQYFHFQNILWRALNAHQYSAELGLQKLMLGQVDEKRLVCREITDVGSFKINGNNLKCAVRYQGEDLKISQIFSAETRLAIVKFAGQERFEPEYAKLAVVVGTIIRDLAEITGSSSYPPSSV